MELINNSNAYWEVDSDPTGCLNVTMYFKRSKRDDRNDKINDILEKIGTKAALITAKTERLRILRDHYEAYLNRVYPLKSDYSSGSYSSRSRSFEDLFIQEPSCLTFDLRPRSEDRYWSSSARMIRKPYLEEKLSTSTLDISSPRLNERSLLQSNEVPEIYISPEYSTSDEFSRFAGDFESREVNSPMSDRLDISYSRDDLLKPILTATSYPRRYDAANYLEQTKPENLTTCTNCERLRRSDRLRPTQSFSARSRSYNDQSPRFSESVKVRSNSFSIRGSRTTTDSYPHNINLQTTSSSISSPKTNSMIQRIKYKAADLKLPFQRATYIDDRTKYNLEKSKVLLDRYSKSPNTWDIVKNSSLRDQYIDNYLEQKSSRIPDYRNNFDQQSLLNKNFTLDYDYGPRTQFVSSKLAPLTNVTDTSSYRQYKHVTFAPETKYVPKRSSSFNSHYSFQKNKYTDNSNYLRSSFPSSRAAVSWYQTNYSDPPARQNGSYSNHMLPSEKYLSEFRKVPMYKQYLDSDLQLKRDRVNVGTVDTVEIDSRVPQISVQKALDLPCQEVSEQFYRLQRLGEKPVETTDPLDLTEHLAKQATELSQLKNKTIKDIAEKESEGLDQSLTEKISKDVENKDIDKDSLPEKPCLSQENSGTIEQNENEATDEDKEGKNTKVEEIKQEKTVETSLKKPHEESSSEEIALSEEKALKEKKGGPAIDGESASTEGANISEEQKLENKTKKESQKSISLEGDNKAKITEEEQKQKTSTLEAKNEGKSVKVGEESTENTHTELQSKDGVIGTDSTEVQKETVEDSAFNKNAEDTKMEKDSHYYQDEGATNENDPYYKNADPGYGYEDHQSLPADSDNTVPYYDEQTQPPYGDQLHAPYDEHAQPLYEQQLQQPYDESSHHEQHPYEDHTQPPYEEQLQQPYEEHSQKQYEEQVHPMQNPYEDHTQAPYEGQLQQPYEESPHPAYEDHVQQPYVEEQQKPYDEQPYEQPVHPPYAEEYNPNEYPEYDERSKNAYDDNLQYDQTQAPGNYDQYKEQPQEYHEDYSRKGADGYEGYQEDYSVEPHADGYRPSAKPEEFADRRISKEYEEEYKQNIPNEYAHETQPQDQYGETADGYRNADIPDQYVRGNEAYGGPEGFEPTDYQNPKGEYPDGHYVDPKIDYRGDPQYVDGQQEYVDSVHPQYPQDVYQQDYDAQQQYAPQEAQQYDEVQAARVQHEAYEEPYYKPPNQ